MFSSGLQKVVIMVSEGSFNAFKCLTHDCIKDQGKSTPLKYSVFIIAVAFLQTYTTYYFVCILHVLHLYGFPSAVTLKLNIFSKSILGKCFFTTRSRETCHFLTKRVTKTVTNISSNNFKKLF